MAYHWMYNSPAARYTFVYHPPLVKGEYIINRRLHYFRNDDIQCSALMRYNTSCWWYARLRLDFKASCYCGIVFSYLRCALIFSLDYGIIVTKRCFMNKRFLRFSFILYIAVLLWVILLRMNLAEFTGRYNGIVLIPFSDDQNYTSSLARDLCNVGNVALFFPVGFAGMLLCSDGKSKLLSSLGKIGRASCRERV